jgi:hypothetical protein
MGNEKGSLICCLCLLFDLDVLIYPFLEVEIEQETAMSKETTDFKARLRNEALTEIELNAIEQELNELNERLPVQGIQKQVRLGVADEIKAKRKAFNRVEHEEAEEDVLSERDQDDLTLDDAVSELSDDTLIDEPTEKPAAKPVVKTAEVPVIESRPEVNTVRTYVELQDHIATLTIAKDVLLTYVVGMDKKNLETFLDGTLENLESFVEVHDASDEAAQLTLAGIQTSLEVFEQGFIGHMNFEGQGGEEVGVFYDLMTQFVVGVRACLNMITVAFGFESDRNTWAEGLGRMFFFQAPLASSEHSQLEQAKTDVVEAMHVLEASFQRELPVLNQSI